MPSLDGTRGVAILLVVVSHFGMLGTAARPELEWIVRLGDFGVKMFFVLSGFLITTLLVSEHRTSGTIGIRRFFVRRALRILPAAYTFMLVVFVAAALGLVRLEPGDSFFAATYTMNFHTHPSWWLGHTWSLSIEEQFYLFWPLALLLVRPSRAARVALATIVAAPLARGLLILAFPTQEEGLERAFIAAADGFAAGSLLSFLRPRLEANVTYSRWLHSRWTLVLVPAAALANQLEHHPLAYYTVLEPLVFVWLAISLHRVLAVPGDLVGRALNWPALAWLGSISYSLYLWQQPFLAPGAAPAPARLAIGLACAIATAWASYTFIERPCLRFRDRRWPARSRTESPRSAPGVAAPAASSL